MKCGYQLHMGVARRSGTDVIVGRRFTGVFAKIAATEVVSRPLVLIRCQNRLTSATRSLLPSDMVAIACRTLPSST